MKKTLLVALVAASIVACGEKSAEEYYALGQKAYADEQYQTATIELKNAIRLAPEQAGYRFLLGQVYLQQNDFTFAEKELEKALEYGHPANEIIPILSSLYRDMGNQDQLFKLNAKAKGLKPIDVAQLKAYQIEAYIEQGNMQKAQVSIDELKTISEGGPYTQQALAYQLIIANDLASAITQVESILQSYPNHGDTLKLLGVLHLNNQNVEQALIALEAYLADNDDDEMQFRVARILSGQNAFVRAEPLVDELLVKYPSHALLLQLKAAARLHEKDYEVANKFAEMGLTTEPEDRPSRLIAGISHYFLGQFEESLGDLTLVASELPASHPALRMLVDIQLRLGLALDASDTLSQFEQLSEAEYALATGVGQALVNKGEYKRAKSIVAAQSSEVQSPKLLANLATLKLSLNDVSGIVDLERALANQGSEQQALNSFEAERVLVNAYLATGRLDDALKLVQQWQSDENRAEAGILLESRILQQQGKQNDARNTLLEAIKTQPASAEYYLALSELLDEKDNQQNQQAKEYIKQGLALSPNHLPSIIKWYLIERSDGSEQQVKGYLQEQLKQTPTDMALKITLARIFVIEHQANEAVALLEPLDQGASPVHRQVLAQAYTKNKQIDKLKQLYSDWYELNPNHVAAIAGMMKVHESRQELEKALAVADKYLIEQGGEAPAVLVAKIEVLAMMGRTEEVKLALDSVPAGLIETPRLQSVSGQLALNNKQFRQAETLLKQAYKAIPTSRNAALLSSALMGSEGQPKALAFLKLHVKNHPTDKRNNLRVAQVLTGKNNSEAKFYYLQALKIDDRLFVAHNNVAHMYLLENNLDKAYEHAVKAQNLQPRQADVLDTLGYIELKIGKHEEALNHLSLAVEAFGQKIPDEALLNYVEALLINGQKRLAQRKLDQHEFSGDASERLLAIKKQYQL